MDIIVIQVIASVISLSALAWYIVRSQRMLNGAVRAHELGAFSRGVKRPIAALDAHHEEVVHLIGVVHGETKRAPLSKRECIAWQVRVFARWNRATSELHQQSEIVGGTIKDDSGEVRFDGQGGKAILTGNPFRADDVPQTFRKAAEAILTAQSPRPLDYHAIETILVNGDRAALTARVPSRAGDGYRDGQALRLVSRSDAELVVTDDVELLRS